jgi:hypothetical protein
MLEMKPSEIMFSVNAYDSDGDIVQKGVFLHFGDTRVRAADSIKEFSDILQHLEAMVEEIETNYMDLA